VGVSEAEPRVKRDTAGLGTGLDRDGDPLPPRPAPPVKVQKLNSITLDARFDRFTNTLTARCTEPQPTIRIPAVGREVCKLPIPSQLPGGTTDQRARHESSLAHQICLTHSHPPSHSEAGGAECVRIGGDEGACWVGVFGDEFGAGWLITEQQRPFSSGIRRKRVQFVRSSDLDTTTAPTPSFVFRGHGWDW
jgi:hypothetical protein